MDMFYHKYASWYLHLIFFHFSEIYTTKCVSTSTGNSFPKLCFGKHLEKCVENAAF